MIDREHELPLVRQTDQFTSAFGHVCVPQTKRQTSTAFTGLLLENKIAISMDGRGSWRDNVLVPFSIFGFT